MEGTEKKSGALFWRVLLQAKPYWFYLFLILFLNIAAVPLVLLKPLALKILIDSGFGNIPVPAFISSVFPDGFVFDFQSVVWISVGLVLTVALIENLYTVSVWLLNTFTGEKIVLNFRTALFNHVQRLSLIHHDSHGTSDSLYRIQYDANSIKAFLINNLSPLITSSVTLVTMLVVMFTINAEFALIIVSIIPVLIILIRRSSAKLKKGWKAVKQNESSAMSVVNEVLSALRVVKSFGREDSESERFSDRSEKTIQGQLKVARTGAWFYFTVGMIFAAGTAIFIYMGAYKIRSGEITLGELTMILAYMTQIYGPIEKISRNINDIQSSFTSIERVYSIMDKEKEVVDNNSHTRLHHIDGQFSFRHISFSYQSGKKVLSDVGFEILPGDRVGIIGSTGSGKSTLLSLLSRFYDPTEGQIVLDGEDIRNISLKNYRSIFSFVLQEPVLFSTSIAENIAYGRPDADRKQIIEAAKNANAHEFIMKFPDGYDTPVGERGMQLSGGERQRISIARAFVKNAPVLILDEPTSSVDIHTEHKIIEAIQRLISGRNTFLVTHRLDTLRMCNVIIHLEGGRVIDIIRDPKPHQLELKKQFHHPLIHEN